MIHRKVLAGTLTLGLGLMASTASADGWDDYEDYMEEVRERREEAYEHYRDRMEERRERVNGRGGLFGGREYYPPGQNYRVPRYPGRNPYVGSGYYNPGYANPYPPYRDRDDDDGGFSIFGPRGGGINIRW